MSDETDGTVDLSNRTKAAMRQTETFLNKSGKEVPKTKTPISTRSSTSTPPSLGIHGGPNDNRKKWERANA